ncbi:MAG: class I SAM-dependent methyltransferase [Planctomycetota bacterium]
MARSTIANGLRILRAEGLDGFVDALRARRSGGNRGEWTPYLQWLAFAVPGGLARGNVWCMDYAIQRLPTEHPIIEIGSSCGLSANAMTYMKERYGVGNALYTCDPWTFDGGPEVGEMLGDSQTVQSGAYRDFMKESYVRNTRFFSANDLPHTVECTSDAFFESWRAGATRTDVFGRSAELGGPAAFCYIDGNHTYEVAKRDFENCDEVLVDGGFLLFDDSGDDTDWGSRDVAREVARSGRYELIAKNPNYFFRKKAQSSGVRG